VRDTDPERARPPLPVAPLLGAFRAPRRPIHLGAATPAFLAVYERYPNGAGKMAAAQVFQDVAAEVQGGEQALTAAILAAFDGGLLSRHPYDGPARYVKALEHFLAERRWEDRTTAPTAARVSRDVERDYKPPKLVFTKRPRAEGKG
jgi:hypothetical protein